MKTKIIMISGKQGSGKTTLMNALIARGNELGIVSHNVIFADTIYKIHDFANELLAKRGYQRPPDFVKDGKLLQLLGTEWGRTCLGDNIWVDCLKGEIQSILDESALARNPHAKIIFIVSDCRFRNEFDGVDAFKVRLEASKEVRKSRCSQWRENDVHISEIDLDGYARDGKFDCYVDTELDKEDTVNHITQSFDEWLGREDETHSLALGYENVKEKYYV